MSRPRVMSRVRSLLLAGCLCLRAAGADENPAYALDTGAGFPDQTVWGRDWANGGTPSVLIFYGNDPLGYGKEQGKLAAFRRALGGEVEYVIFTSFGSRPPQRDNGRAQRLLSERDWDVLLFWVSPETHTPSSNWGLLSDRLKARILDLAARGKPIVFLGGKDKWHPGYPRSVCTETRETESTGAEILAGLGMLSRYTRMQPHYFQGGLTRWDQPVPRDEDAFRTRYIRTFTLDRGRAFVLECASMANLGSLWSEAVPVSREHRIDPDYLHAELVRVLVHAAGRAPEVAIVAQPPSPWTVDWNTPFEAAWELDVRGPARDVLVTWRLRNLRGEVLVEGLKRFPDAAGRLNVVCGLPALGAGHYYVDLLIDSHRGRENFGYAGLAVTARGAVTVTTEAPAVMPGQPIRGKIAVDGFDEAPAPPDAVLINLCDAHDRTLQQAMHRVPDAGPLNFELATDAHDTMQLYIDVNVLARGCSLASATRTVNLLQRRRDRFNVTLWGGPTGIYAEPIKKRLWQSGVTAAMHLPDAAQANLMHVRFIGGNAWAGEWNGEQVKVWTAVKPDPETGIPTMHPVCWNDPDFEKILDFQDHHWQGGEQSPVYVYNLYDEGPHRGCCLSPHCLAAYREWLKERYAGDLAALNREWEAAYAGWDAVTVLEPGDVLEKKAKEQGIYPRWSDRAHFNEVNFCRRILGGLSRRARAVDPDARIGFEGSGGFGMDFDALFDHSGFWCPYEGPQMDILRSKAPDRYVYGYWIGYSKEADTIIRRTWDMVFDGSPSVWWWMYAGRGRYHGWFADNGAAYPSRQKLIDECIHPLRRGLGDLLVRLPRRHDGVALYYSVAATHSDQVPREAPFNDFREANEAFGALLTDLGYQWIQVTRRDLLEGRPAEQGVRFLILPAIRPLGEDEVAALRAFVAEGGFVLADSRPGVLSGHCRPLASGSADALFGVIRTGEGTPAWLGGSLTTSAFGAEIDVTLAQTRGDGALELRDGARAAMLDGIPVCIENRIGKGAAILLNFHVCQYGVERGTDFGRALRDLVGGALHAAGLQPRVRCSAADGRELAAVRRTSWQQGGVTVHGLLMQRGDPVEAAVSMGEEGHLFELRTGALGRVRTPISLTLVPGRARFLAVYPYEPGEVLVRPVRPAAAAGERLDFEIELSGVPAGETGIFSFETTLFDPSGARVDIMPWSVQGVAGRARTHVRFALDDPVGIWRLVVREITTGRAAECRLQLRAPGTPVD